MSYNKNKLNVVFPMAGEGSRFNYKFKPFIELGDLTFIERAIEPFLSNIQHIEKFYFIVTKEQEATHNVTSVLRQLLDVPLEVIVIPEKTTGPYQTLKQAAELQPAIRNNLIICDCDHSIESNYIFQNFHTSDCIFPIWKIKDNEQDKWSKAIYNKNELTMICEKEIIISSDVQIFGIIGCIFFASFDSFCGDDDYISDALSSELKRGANIQTYIPETASFFGDTERVNMFIEKCSSKITFFLDYDGSIIKHNTDLEYKADTEILVDLENLQNLQKNGHRIIITTARSPRKKKKMIKVLDMLGIPYDDLIMGCSSGPRVLVNDIKPRKPFLRTARAVNIKRDGGFVLDETVFNYENNIIVGEKLGGFSPANKVVLTDDTKTFVRKIIPKTKENEIHINKLKMQLMNIKRLGFLWKDSVPIIYKDCENDDWYFYDMEYLNPNDGWTSLEESENKEHHLDNIMQKLNNNVYCLNKSVDGISWLKTHIEKKILPKFLIKEEKEISSLFLDDGIIINGKKTVSIKQCLDELDYLKYIPKKICPIHGDLTFENILVNDNAVKLIDMDGSDFYDAPELDLGKLYQSFMMKYFSWKDDDWSITKKGNYKIDDRFFDTDSKLLDNILNNIWCNILTENKNAVKDKSILFSVFHLIRLIPFKLNKNNKHAVLAALLSRYWLNELHNIKENK
jgi:hypothetical protein